MSKKKINKNDIEQHEKDVLSDLEKDQFTSVDDLRQEMRMAKKAADNYMKRDWPD